MNGPRFYQNRTALWVIVVIALTGGALALLATDQTIRIQKIGLTRPSLCNINAWINCEIAQASSHAMMFGIPIAWWGFLYYTWITITLLWTVYKREYENAAFAAAFAVSIPILCYTIYKAYILFFILDIVCPVCVAMYTVNLSIILVLKKHLNIRCSEIISFIKDYIRLVFGKYSVIYLAAILILFGSGTGAFKYLEPRIYTLPDIDVAAAISEHYEQPVYEINLDHPAPVSGNPDNPVKIHVFSDFQCPACRLAAFHLKAVLLDHTYISMVFLNYPLDEKINPYVDIEIHKHAGLAARAGICAQQSGDFWAFHDELFRRQDTIDRFVVMSIAEQNGWDLEKFTSCMDSEDSFKHVQRDIELGNRLYVDSTPTIFINGREIENWHIPDILRGIIREEYRMVMAEKED